MAIKIMVEVDPGSEITDAFQQAIELSNRINIRIEFKFNDVICFVRPGSSVRIGVKEWNEAMESKNKYKFARSY